MRTWTLLLGLFGCPAPLPEPSPPPDDVEASLKLAWEAWRADPSAAMDQLSLAAAAAQDVPIGDREFDVLLGEVLSDGLLRPDLGHPRLEPYAASLQGREREVWLDTLLRHNDLPAFAAEVLRQHDVRLDPEQPALRAAMNQAILHREIRWKQAIYAHQAGVLAARQIDYGRPEMDQPFKRLDYAVDALATLVPGWDVDGVLTRTTLQTDPDPFVTAGEIPVQRDTRRVIAYADDAPALDRAVEGVVAAPPQRIVGLVIRATGPDREVLLCGEGRFREGQFWMISACNPAQTYVWMRASELYADLATSGTPPDEIHRQVREAWAEKFQPASSPSSPKASPTP